MWIESVVLKNHGDIPVLWRQIIDTAVADENVASRNFFQAGDHTQCRRLPAPRRSDEHQKFSISYFETDILDCRNVPAFFRGIILVNMAKGDIGHRCGWTGENYQRQGNLVKFAPRPGTGGGRCRHLSLGHRPQPPILFPVH